MKIFYSFLIVFSAAVLFFIPITDGVHDFRTDVKEDSFFVTTAGGTTGNVTLLKSLYDNDVASVALISSDSTDSPVVAGYHSTTRVLDVTGLTTSSNRTLTASYEFDALGGSTAIDLFLDKVAWIWLLCVIAFAPAALAAIWMGKA